MRRMLRFPDFKSKAVTLSYDDGKVQDKRLIAIMSKYGLKGTFNLNGGLLGTDKDRRTADEIVKLYSESGNEVAVHGYKHLSLSEVDGAMAINDVIEDRKALEKLFGKVIKGMAYSNGFYSDEVVELLKMCGISYSRTTVSTEKFDLPTDWLRLPATCHHNNPRLMELAKQFVESEGGRHWWSNHSKLFYLWGHSYEFDNNQNWNVIEEFAADIGGREDIWYATNGEIYEYVQAFDRLEFSADGERVYNPSAIDVYIQSLKGELLVPAGKTV